MRKALEEGDLVNLMSCSKVREGLQVRVHSNPLILPIWLELVSFNVMETANSRYPEYSNFLLFEIPPILFIYENQIQVIPCREFLIDISERRRQFEPTQE